jgi:hypothetical protein
MSISVFVMQNLSYRTIFFSDSHSHVAPLSSKRGFESYFKCSLAVNFIIQTLQICSSVSAKDPVIELSAKCLGDVKCKNKMTSVSRRYCFIISS